MLSNAVRKNFLEGFGFKSISDFQKHAYLVADGSWGSKTDAQARSMTRGLQMRLNQFGFKLSVDGSYGNATKQAVIKFKTAHGMSATNKIGEKTRAILYKEQPEKLSAHFRKSEFKCECGGKYCDGYNFSIVDPKLVSILEKIRTDCGGKPITVTSGIRCQLFNDSLVGSVKNSPHLSGKAADIYVKGVSPATVRKLAYKYGANYSYYGTANMGNACHINT